MQHKIYWVFSSKSLFTSLWLEALFRHAWMFHPDHIGSLFYFLHYLLPPVFILYPLLAFWTYPVSEQEVTFPTCYDTNCEIKSKKWESATEAPSPFSAYRLLFGCLRPKKKLPCQQHSSQGIFILIKSEMYLFSSRHHGKYTVRKRDWFYLLIHWFPLPEICL